LLGAELLDDLDVRSITKIGRQQTGGDKKRGSWQITAQKLKLISDSVPGFEELSVLADRLLQAGNDIQATDRAARQKGTEDFYAVQDEIRAELSQICESRDSSKGLETLKQSLALSSTYKSLCDRIKNAENSSVLNLLIKDANVEIDVYAQRSKHLNKLIEQRKELIGAAGENLDQLLSDLKEPETKTEEVDF
jgi:hypothetical protein